MATALIQQPPKPRKLLSDHDHPEPGTSARVAATRKRAARQAAAQSRSYAPTAASARPPTYSSSTVTVRSKRDWGLVLSLAAVAVVLERLLSWLAHHLGHLR